MTLKTLYSLLVFYIHVSFLSSQSIRVRGDVVVGRPFTLECKITRPTGDRIPLSWFSQVVVSTVSSQSITVPGDVVAGRPFPLECKITRPAGDRLTLIWSSRVASQNPLSIYGSRECTPSIPVISPPAPAGLSGGCQHVNGEEVYTVRIENVTEDTGRVTWICQYGPNDPANVILDIQVMVTRLSPTNPLGTLTAGDPTTFTCVTSASKPQACISCYIRSSGNVRELDPADCNPETSSVQTTTRTLTFTASVGENGAELYCDADNSVTDPPVRSQVYTLNVHFGPVTVQLLADSGQSGNTVTVTENSTVTFTCTSGESNPAAVLSWYNNNSPIPAAEASEVSSQPGPNLGYLTTQRYTVRVDRYLHGHVIRCEARRPGQVSLVSSTLTCIITFGPDTVQQLRADSGQSGNTVTVTENSTVTFTCTSGESNPAAVLSWYNNNSPIPAAEVSEVSSQPGPNLGYLTTQRYTVRVDRYIHGHVIRCEAPRTGQSTAVSEGLSLDVQFPPVSPNQTNPQTAALGETWRLAFKFVSNPSVVNLTWYNLTNGTSDRLTVPGSKYRQHVREDKDRVLVSGISVPFVGHLAELEISNITRQDFGEYELKLENGIGSSRTRISFMLIDRPCSPTITQLLCSGGSANLTWISCFDGGSVQHFVIEYRRDGENWKVGTRNIRDPGEGKTMSGDVPDLVEGERYRFRVYGQNRWNKSDPAETDCTVTGTTGPLGPSQSDGGVIAAGVLSSVGVIILIVVAVVIIIRRRNRADIARGDNGPIPQTSPESEYEMPGAARVYQTLSVPSETTDQPVYVNSPDDPEYVNSQSRAANQQDTAYEKLKILLHPIAGTNRVYENTVIH